jgi:hypothetical protein
MSLIDKVKSLFSGGSAADAHDHAGHDHSDHDHSHDSSIPPVPPADPTGMPMPDPDPGAGADEDRPA